MDELDFSDLSNDDLEGLRSILERSETDAEQTDQEVPTGTPSPPPEQVQQPSTEGTEQTDEAWKIPRSEDVNDGSLGGILKGTAVGMAETAAPLVGIADTAIDTINFLSAGDTFDIPKIPEYESNTTQALRNISGLIIPSLGLRAKLLAWGTKAHKAATAPKFLQTLGNSRSFQYFAKFGADIGTGGLVDYVAEQNQRDDNLFGTLKHYWPQTFQWIPNSIATNADDTPGERRAKNVNEGAIFGVLGSIVEGVAYLTGAGRSLKRTARFKPGKETKISSTELNARTTDEFSTTKFSDKPIENQVLQDFARKEHDF